MAVQVIAMAALAIGGGIIGGVSARSAAKRQNKAIAEAAKVNMASVDQNIKQNRLAFLDTTEIASRQAQTAYGQANNAVGFDGGISTTQYIAASVADAYADQLIREQNFQAQEQAFGLQKESISRQARAGMIDQSAATIQGGIGGAQTGLAIGSALGNLADAGQQASAAEAQSALVADQRKLVGLQIQGAQDQLKFSRDVNLWQTQRFGAALQQRQALSASPFRGSTYFSGFFTGSTGGLSPSNPILPYTGGR